MLIQVTFFEVFSIRERDWIFEQVRTFWIEKVFRYRQYLFFVYMVILLPLSCKVLVGGLCLVNLRLRLTVIVLVHEALKLSNRFVQFKEQLLFFQLVLLHLFQGFDLLSFLLLVIKITYLFIVADQTLGFGKRLYALIYELDRMCQLIIIVFSLGDHDQRLSLVLPPFDTVLGLHDGPLRKVFYLWPLFALFMTFGVSDQAVMFLILRLHVEIKIRCVGNNLNQVLTPETILLRFFFI